MFVVRPRVTRTRYLYEIHKNMFETMGERDTARISMRAILKYYGDHRLPVPPLLPLVGRPIRYSPPAFINEWIINLEQELNLPHRPFFHPSRVIEDDVQWPFIFPKDYQYEGLLDDGT
jgi:hypothetical protein